MKPKKNIAAPFALSPALLTENLKRNWYLPALAFLVYFTAGLSPLLMGTVQNDQTSVTIGGRMLTYLDQTLNNWNTFYVLVILFLPLIAAVSMMGFLHRQDRAMAIHSQPFSRNKIFSSHVLAGWLLCTIPVLLMFLCFLPYANQATDGADAVANWFLSTLSMITFFYGIYVLAGSLCGTSIMQAAVSAVLFGIVPLLMWLTFLYCENFLPGYHDPAKVVVDFMSASNPLLYMAFNPYSSLSLASILIYLVLGLVMILLAGLAYKRAKLERVGDSMLYPAFEDLITWLITFVGMTAMGFFLYGIGGTKGFLLVGMIFGTAITFFLVKIAFRRSVRILTKENLRSLALYIVIAALFCSVTILDVTRYGQKVPSPDQVVSISRQTFDYSGMNREFSFPSMDSASESEFLSSPEAVEAILALHQYIVDEKLYEKEAFDEAPSSGFTTSLDFFYTLKDGSQLERSFYIPLTDEVCQLLNTVVTGQEYKEDGSLAQNISLDAVKYIQINAFDYNADQTKGDEIYDDQANRIPSLIIDEPDRLKKLVAAMDKDYYNRTYQTPGTGHNFGGVEIDVQILLNDSKTDYDSKSPSVYFNLKPGDKNTISVLKEICKEKGYDYYENLFTGA